MATNTKKLAYLEDLEVDEVSLVDAPANKRPFLVVKNADGQAPADGAVGDAPVVDPVVPAADGAVREVVITDPTPTAVPTPEPTPEPVPAPTPEPAGDAVATEKRGAKMAKERLARFKDAVATLASIAGEIEPALVEMADAADALDGGTDGVAKRADNQRTLVAKVASLEAQLTESKAALDGQAEELKTAKAELAEAKATVAKQADAITRGRFDVIGNAKEVETEPVNKSVAKPVTWGGDLNVEFAKEKRQAAQPAK